MADEFQAEWDALVAQARDTQSTRMQLNSPAPIGGSGDSGKLGTDETATAGAASYVEDTLLPDIRSAHALVGGQQRRSRRGCSARSAPCPTARC